MMNKQVFRRGLTAVAGIALCTMSFSLLAAQESKWRLVQTNNAGDSLSVIDPATNKVVGQIPGIEMAHGISVAKDNSRIYVAQESTASLLVVDGKTLQITKRIPLSGSPNLVQLTPDGKTMYVSINLRWTLYQTSRSSRLSRAAASTLLTSPRLRKPKPSRSLAASTTCTSPRTASTWLLEPTEIKFRPANAGSPSRRTWGT